MKLARKKLVLLGILGSVFAVTALAENAVAQSPTGINPITPTPPETPKLELPEVPGEVELETPKPTYPDPQLSGEIPGSIKVEQFIFSGNTAFSTGELRELLQDLIEKKEITFGELLQAERTITNKYTNAGYINSGAVIPAGQTFSKEGAIVQIQVIEGTIADIKIEGLRRLNPHYIRSRLKLATATPFNQQELLSALQMLQLDPLIESISAQLSAGARQSASLLAVRVEEANSFSAELIANNGRSPSVGSFRRGVRVKERNFLGLGDSISLDLTNTDGSDAFNVSYSIPINSQNGKITLGWGLSDTKVIEPPFNQLDITGDSRYFELTLRQPLSTSVREEFALGLTLSRQESEAILQINGLRVPLSPGANEDGETRISAVRFFQDWTKRNSAEVFAFRSQFSLGVGTLDATLNRPQEQPDSDFFSWRWQGQYVRRLAEQSLLVVRSDLQLATETLVPLEQIGIGGFGSVRGYRQDTLLTDNGLFISGEVRLPVARWNKGNGVLQIVPFVDFGLGWNSSDLPDPNPNSLVGTGLGLNLQINDDFNARFDWGIPLTDVDNSENSFQENGLYFSVEAKL